MSKKLTTLFLSLLICMSLMPGRVYATDSMNPGEAPVQAEFLNAKTPDEPENPVMPLDYPKNEGSNHPGT